MATQSKFNTVLPSNTVQQGLIYTPISSVYANSINTIGQAENVMTANDVELSLNTHEPGSTASINIPASYKLLGNMYLKLKVKLSTLLATPMPADSKTYKEIYDKYSEKALIFGNTPNQFDTIISNATDTTPVLGIPYVQSAVKTGSINTGLPMDLNFMAYNLIKQFTWRIPGCDRLYIQGMRMLPLILDKCPNDEERQKIAMMSGTGHHLYSYNMVEGTVTNMLTPWKKSIEVLDTPATGEGLSEDQKFVGDYTDHTPVSALTLIENPTFVIYALLDLPWSTIDKDKPGLYYPSHMTTSALELNIQFQDRDYLQVPAEPGYSGYKIDIIDASLRFTYAAVATMTYYKPPIYKLPCSLHYDFEFPVADFDGAKECRTNLLGLKNGEITQLLMFIHQSEGSTATNVSGLVEVNPTNSLRYKWRNEPLKNLQVEYAGQIIWKGVTDGYDFMNQFDNRKSWSAFKLPSLMTSKTVGPEQRIFNFGPHNLSGNPGASNTIVCQIPAGGTDETAQGFQQFGSFYECTDAYIEGARTGMLGAIGTNAGNNPFPGARAHEANDYFTRSVEGLEFLSSDKTSLSNGYDVSALPMYNIFKKSSLNGNGNSSLEKQMGLDLYKRSLLDGPLFASSGQMPYTKINRWHTPQNTKSFYDNRALSYTPTMISGSTAYHFSDCFHWTVVPVAEKIDQIRGPRDYALGADFKDSNLVVKFSGYDALSSAIGNDFVSGISKKIKWTLHVVASITSAFIFNGDKADLMQ